MKRFLRYAGAFLPVTLSLAGCSSTPDPGGRHPEKPTGFFERLSDRMTPRECLVYRFSCPYGFGPAGEPCECTDPSGRVWQGKTIK